MVHKDVRPLSIMTREAFHNAIVVCSAIGGSTNAVVHINAIARHAQVELTMDDWERIGHHVPLLVNVQPAGAYLAEDYWHAGGVPAVIGELLRAGLIVGTAPSVTGRTIGQLYDGVVSSNADVILPADRPLLEDAGLVILTGNLFDSAVMKVSVISPEFRTRYLARAEDPDAMELRAVVFDGSDDYHARIDDPVLGVDADCLLVMRLAGPLGFPGSGEVVNMRPPKYLIEQGIRSLPCLGDGRQSGTSDAPSILNAAPEAAAGGGLAWLRTGDRVRIDLARRRVDALVDPDEWSRRQATGPMSGPAPATPWQAIQSSMVSGLDTGMVLEPAVEYFDVGSIDALPRHSH